MKDKNRESMLFDQQLIKKIYPAYSEIKLIQCLKKYPAINFSLGSMFGSFMGDSLGSYLEFAKEIREQDLQNAMLMIPGGTFNLRAGQVTDDSEMSFHLLKTLCTHNFQSPFSEQSRRNLILGIANQYVQWKYKSKPFDIGNTCRAGIKILSKYVNLIKVKNQLLQKQKLKQMFLQIENTNSKSESNGSLMRITPLVFFATLYSSKIQLDKQIKENFKQFVKDQVRLVHPNKLVVRSSFIWVNTLLRLCQRKSNAQFRQIFLESLQYANKYQLESWVDEVKSKQPMTACKNIGWGKIAWSYGFRVLKQIIQMNQRYEQCNFGEFQYKKTIKQIIKRGGDTDTNAAIVGGLIGAVIGFRNLPKDYLTKMMKLDFSDKQLQRSHDRPIFYQPRRVFVNIYQTLQKLYLIQPEINPIKPKY